MLRSIALLCLACLLPLPARADAPESLAAWAKRSQGRHAYGVYVGGKKVGWSVEELKLGKRGGQDVLVAVSQMYLRTAFDGEKTESDETTTVAYALEGDGPILHAEMRTRRDKLSQVRRAEPRGKG